MRSGGAPTPAWRRRSRLGRIAGGWRFDHPFRKGHPVVQVGDLGAEGIEFVEDRRGSARRNQSIRLGLPVGDQAPFGIAERSRGDEDVVVEIPEPQAAERARLQDAALDLADVESVRAKDAEEDGEELGDQSGF